MAATKSPATYATAVAYGKCHTYACGRCLNNRGSILVWQLGRYLWRADTRKKVTKQELGDDGFHFVAKQYWGR